VRLTLKLIAAFAYLIVLLQGGVVAVNGGREDQKEVKRISMSLLTRVSEPLLRIGESLLIVNQ